MEQKKLSRREMEKHTRRSQMLDAAAELFSKRGYLNVSMRQIAEKAEFAVGTLYKFFKNKEDLYQNLRMEIVKGYHEILTRILSKKKEDVLGILSEYADLKTRFFKEKTAALRLYYAEVHGLSFKMEAGYDPEIRNEVNKLIDALASVFEAGVRKKVFRDFDPYCMALHLEAVTNACLFSWMEGNQRVPCDTAVPRMMDMFMKGVLRRELEA